MRFKKHYKIIFFEGCLFTRNIKNLVHQLQISVSPQKGVFFKWLVFYSSQTTIFLQESGFWKMPDFVPVLGVSLIGAQCCYTTSTEQRKTLKPRFFFGDLVFVAKQQKQFLLLGDETKTLIGHIGVTWSKTGFCFESKKVLFQKPLVSAGFWGFYSWFVTLYFLLLFLFMFFFCSCFSSSCCCFETLVCVCSGCCLILCCLFCFFLWRFKGQVRWPDGPPLLALNPPCYHYHYYYFVLFCLCFVFFLLFFVGWGFSFCSLLFIRQKHVFPSPQKALVCWVSTLLCPQPFFSTPVDFLSFGFLIFCLSLFSSSCFLSLFLSLFLSWFLSLHLFLSFLCCFPSFFLAFFVFRFFFLVCWNNPNRT